MTHTLHFDPPLAVARVGLYNGKGVRTLQRTYHPGADISGLPSEVQKEIRAAWTADAMRTYARWQADQDAEAARLRAESADAEQSIQDNARLLEAMLDDFAVRKKTEVTLPRDLKDAIARRVAGVPALSP